MKILLRIQAFFRKKNRKIQRSRSRFINQVSKTFLLCREKTLHRDNIVQL